MKQEYDFLQENPWQQTVGNAIGGLARNGGFVNGAVAGAGIGAAGGVVKNALKSDQDPTKKGVVGSAIGGAVTGGVTGAILGRAGGALARSSVGKGVQKELFKDAARVHAQQGIDRALANGALRELPENPTPEQVDAFREKLSQHGENIYKQAMNSIKMKGSGQYSFHSGPWKSNEMTYDPNIFSA